MKKLKAVWRKKKVKVFGKEVHLIIIFSMIAIFLAALVIGTIRYAWAIRIIETRCMYEGMGPDVHKGYFKCLPSIVTRKVVRGQTIYVTRKLLYPVYVYGR